MSEKEFLNLINQRNWEAYLFPTYNFTVGELNLNDEKMDYEQVEFFVGQSGIFPMLPQKT